MTSEPSEAFRWMRLLRAWLPGVAGSLFAVMALTVLRPPPQQNFEEAALGDENTSTYPGRGGYRVHCSTLPDVEECIHGWQARGSHHSVVWFGNSQLHAINQRKEGEEPGSAWLHDQLWTRHQVDAVTFSQPNANLQEHLVLWEYLQPRLATKVLLLPLVFDDLRETGLRSEIASALEDSETLAALEASEVGHHVVAQSQQSKSRSDAFSKKDDSVAGLKDTFQEKVELALNGWFERNSDLWRARGQIRSALIWKLFFLRNRVFGITAQTKRPMIPSRQDFNMRAFEQILQSASEHEVKVLAYIAPLRKDVEVPYISKEYEAFKRDAELLVTKFGGAFKDLDSIVPSRLWGTKNATDLNAGQELDFMHFQAEGHRLLAAALFEQIEKLLGLGS